MTIYSLTHSSTTWMNLIDPTQRDIEALQRAYPFIHPLNIEDMTSISERPKIDLEDDYVFTVLHFPRWDEKLRLSRSSEVDIVVGRGFLITSHDGSLKPLERLYRGAESDMEKREQLLGRGAAHAYYLVIDALVDHMFPILRKVDQNIRRLEERIFIDEGRVIIRDIAELRRDIIALRRIIRQIVPTIETLDRYVAHVFRDDLEDYFDDIVDHIHRARDIIDEDSEVIANLADTADKLLSHRLNNIIRVLTIFSVIMLPLTLVSSIYGMNIDLPLQTHPESFEIVAGIMLMIAVMMLVYFRIRRWL